MIRWAERVLILRKAGVRNPVSQVASVSPETAVSGAQSDAGRSFSASRRTCSFIGGGHLVVAGVSCGAQGLGSSTCWTGTHEPLTAASARPLGDQYALKMRLVDHVFDEQVIDSLTVKIILPEGAK